MNIGTCIHFTGIQNDVCKAGYSYSELGCSIRKYLPCLRRLAGSYGVTSADCLHYLDPTPEQIATEDAEMAAFMAKFDKANPLLDLIRRKHKGRCWSGVETCPACGGKLHLRHSSNGHIGAGCETPDCITFQE